MKKAQSSDYIGLLQKALGADKDGNVEIGKNIDIDGSLLTLDGQDFQIIKLKYYDSDSGMYTDGGYFIGHYTIQTMIRFRAYGLVITPDGSLYNVPDDQVISIDPNKTTDDCIVLSGKTNYDRLLLNKYYTGDHVMPTLYRHNITVSDGTIFANFDIYSQNNLECDSLQDLRTVMHGGQPGKDVINALLYNSNPDFAAPFPTGLCRVLITPAQAQITTSASTAVNITTVSDEVTPNLI